MQKKILLFLLGFGLTYGLQAQFNPLSTPILETSSSLLSPAESKKDSVDVKKLLKKVTVGGLMHFVGVSLQDRPTAAQEADPTYSQKWSNQFNVYRARLLLGVELTSKTNFFMETEIPVIIGREDALGNKPTQVSPILLDAQLEHKFADEFSLIAGLQLVGITRNALQGAASLLALDFGYFQYPYNLFETSALQGNFGRDIGVNARGFLAKGRLEYRLGMFMGRNFDGDDPFRVVGRLNYNFLDLEQGLYYTGASLGTQKLFAIGGGIDLQAGYRNIGFDTFLDLPVGENGAITFSGALNFMTGGTELKPDAFTLEIPKQTISFVELGYYFKTAKLMPYFKYENQNINAETEQNQFTIPISDFNTFRSNRRMGVGMGYYFLDYNATLKLSYESVRYGRANLNGTGAESNSIGEIWAQLQFFIF